ncbi:hypothetical protein [Arvimicrobium flavum]|uniref:hypothetical protein n=1 Tax=Arvimicrobium flavum TaxID=3393320 RepID=UPI00237B3030|nr:hypothetical protein [Mesorhizobium shangrilense]
MPVYKVEVDDETAEAVTQLRARSNRAGARDFWRTTLHEGLDFALVFPEATVEEAARDAARWAAEEAAGAAAKARRRAQVERFLPQLKAWAAAMPEPAGDARVVASVHLRSHEARLAGFLGCVSALQARGLPVGRLEVDLGSAADRRAARDYVRHLVVDELRGEQAKLRDGSHSFLQPGEWEDDEELPF